MVIAWNELVVPGTATPNEFVRMTSTAAAHAFNVYPQKGVVAVGSDADLVIFDPSSTTRFSASTHQSNNDVSVYEGRVVAGAVKHTISRGRVLFTAGSAPVCEPGTSRFVATPPFAPTLFPKHSTKYNTASPSYHENEL